MAATTARCRRGRTRRRPAADHRSDAGTASLLCGGWPCYYGTVFHRGADVPDAGPIVRRRVARGLAWLGFWTILGLVFATQLYLAERRLAEHPYTWWQSVRTSLPDWYVWGLFALLVARMKQRVPIDRVSWGHHFAFHVAASLLLALAHFAIAVPLQRALQD